MTETQTTEMDVVIVGGGAAGLSAALTLGRAGRRTVVIDAGLPRNRFADHMHGYLGQEGTPPLDFLVAGRAEIAAYDVLVQTGEVAEIATLVPGSRFAVTLTDGTTIETRRVLLASGARDVLPEIPGLAERWGHDVLHCPYCHGYEVRGQALGVIATSSMAVHGGLLIRQWSDDLVFFANGMPLADEDRAKMELRGTRIVEAPVRRVVAEDDRLRGVELADGTFVARDALFVQTRLVIDQPWLTSLGVELGGDEMIAHVVTDASGKTSVPGIWAAGNVASPMSQVIMAASAGMMAGATINMDLVLDDIARAESVTSGV